MQEKQTNSGPQVRLWKIHVTGFTILTMLTNVESISKMQMTSLRIENSVVDEQLQLMKNLLSLFPLEIRRCPSAQNWQKAVGVVVIRADVCPSSSIIREAHDWPYIYSAAAQTPNTQPISLRIIFNHKEGREVLEMIVWGATETWWGIWGSWQEEISG